MKLLLLAFCFLNLILLAEILRPSPPVVQSFHFGLINGNHIQNVSHQHAGLVEAFCRRIKCQKHQHIPTNTSLVTSIAWLFKMLFPIHLIPSLTKTHQLVPTANCQLALGLKCLHHHQFLKIDQNQFSLIVIIEEQVILDPCKTDEYSKHMSKMVLTRSASIIRDCRWG